MYRIFYTSLYLPWNKPLNKTLREVSDMEKISHTYKSYMDRPMDSKYLTDIKLSSEKMNLDSKFKELNSRRKLEIHWSVHIRLICVTYFFHITHLPECFI